MQNVMDFALDESPAPPPVEHDIIWHTIVPYFHRCGVNDRQLRSMLGKLARQKGRANLILSFDQMTQARPRPADPWTYFLKICNQGYNNHARRLSPAERAAEAYQQRQQLPAFQ